MSIDEISAIGKSEVASEVDIRDFMVKYEEEILQKGIISPLSETKMLNGKSVDKLIDLMNAKGVSRLTGPNCWCLSSNYDFRNPFAPAGQKEGNLKDEGIQRLGMVFHQQNPYINPLYTNYIRTYEYSDNDKLTEINDISDDKIFSLEMYIRRIGSIQDDNQSSITWYRGHSKPEWKLLPKIYRESEDGKPFGFEADKEFITLYKSYSLPYLEKVPQNEWAWLAIMQHYGMPTRLLDFTEDPFIALGFALGIDKLTETGMHEEVYDDAVVWVFDPLLYNRESKIRLSNIPNMTDLPDDLSSLYIPNAYLHSRTDAPLACIGILDNFRIISQKGTFLLFSRLANKDIRPFEAQCDDKAILSKIIIDKSAIPKMAIQLRNMGYNHTKFYPSLDSVSKDIIYNYCRSKKSEQS